MAMQLFAPGAFAQDASFDCVIEPAVIVSLATPTGGILQTVAVQRGQTVKKGDVVARLRSELEQTTVRLLEERAGNDAEIVAQRARLELARKRLDRIRTLHRAEIGASKDLEEAEAALELAAQELSMAEMNQRVSQIELERAREVLEQRSVISPIDGVVIERLLFDGEYADENAPIARIAQLDPLYVETFLPVDRFKDVSVGDEVEVRPDPPIEGIYSGHISVIDSVFDAASGTFGVRIELSNSDHAIPSGHRCKASI
jgi:RND family efflux transporter MFP subunit